MHIIDQFINEIVLTIIGFIIGIFFKEPIEKKLRHLKTLYKSKKHPPLHVNIFFIDCSFFCSDQLKKLIYNQNKLQSLFEIEIPDWHLWENRGAAEKKLTELNTDSRLDFCNAFQAAMIDYHKDKKQSDHKAINLAITNLPFPKNYYTWNTKDKTGIVIGIRSLNALFNDAPQKVDMIVIRIIQRMLVFSKNIDGLVAHENTRGCLFDLTPRLTDMQFSAENTYICSQCKNAILKECGAEYFAEIDTWVKQGIHQ
ncbi:MAG: hypothetical protein CSA49_06300 [Gammaproteobacteria bacterium]|nr:MAG: hypothetical protein CSA49_06300 [Gammaproteobacteria bacterium]